ncbi:ABC transporter substrate-binding protein [Candidatus Woesearchaeota archaeon]|nr:ABC transporter substrate-binding protein [Candidatus Woesearchaeota archaeon]
MKQTLIAITLALLFLAACVQVDTQTQPTKQVVQPAEKAVVKIGATLPLTGDLAFLGEASKDALELSLKEVSGTKYKYELVFEDDKLDPKLAATAATKLISVDNVDAIVSISSGIGNVVSPIADQNKVIHFSSAASDANVAKGPLNFIHWTPPDEEGKIWVKEAQSRGYKRIAIIAMQQQGAIAIKDSMKKYLPGTGMEVVSEQLYNIGDKDFKTLITKAQQSKPDVYFLMAFSPELDILHKQMKDLGVKEPISGIESFELSDDPSQFEGEWYINAADTSNEFIEKYTAAYGKNPQLGAANSYDILKLIVEGYEKAGKDASVKPSHEAVADAIMQITDFKGALGTVRVEEDGIVWSPASVRIIQDGKPATLK